MIAYWAKNNTVGVTHTVPCTFILCKGSCLLLHFLTYERTQLPLSIRHTQKIDSKSLQL